MEQPKPDALDRPDAVIRDLDEAHLEHALPLWENDPAGTPSRSRSPTCSARSPRASRRSSRSSAARSPARSRRASTARVRGCSAGRSCRNGAGSGIGARAAPRARAAAALARRARHLDARAGLRRGGRRRRAPRATSSTRASLYLEQRRLQTTSSEDRVEELGGQWLPAELWQSIGGMEREKDLIERRVILPLAEREEARRHGVVAASAVMLFGPPGTGKTTFAKAVAGTARLAVRRGVSEPARRPRRARPRRRAARALRPAALPRQRRRVHRRGRGDRVEPAARGPRRARSRTNC